MKGPSLGRWRSQKGPRKPNLWSDKFFLGPDRAYCGPRKPNLRANVTYSRLEKFCNAFERFFTVFF